VALSLAYSKKSSNSTDKAVPDNKRGSLLYDSFTHEYTQLSKAMTHQWMRGNILIGTRVLVGRQIGVVSGYNIAGFGMWMGSVYPLVVTLPDGSVTRCKLCEITPLPSVTLESE
jgi:hypothetical protein